MAKSWQNKVALVTGSSSGIGAATAHLLASKGLKVVLVARRIERLQVLVNEITSLGGNASLIQADLSETYECQDIFRQCIEEFGNVDVLVNNAGLAYYGYTSVMHWETAKEILQVNVIAAAYLTRLFLPMMEARQNGHIINIGSVNGVMPSQGTAFYSGSKAFLIAFTTALYRELRGSGVIVSVINPGPVATELFDNSEKIPNGFRIPAENFAVPAESVAASVWSLLQRPRRIAYVPWYWRWTAITEFAFGWAMDMVGPALLKKQRRGISR